MMTACPKCGQLTPLSTAHGGLSVFCTGCQPSPVYCEGIPHDWHGTPTPGNWVCWRCPAMMKSQTISTQIVHADVPTYNDFYC
jgi:hypothetical protein